MRGPADAKPAQGKGYTEKLDPAGFATTLQTVLKQPLNDRAKGSRHAARFWFFPADSIEDPRMNLFTLHAPTLARRWIPLAVLATAAVLVGCGEKKDKAASQTAAKVNKDEITVHQINFMLQQQRNLRPEQTEVASKQILDRLVEQQLALQKVDELKLDRDPRVVQQLEAARREILARAYVEKVGEAAPKPTAEEIKKYYDDKPELFRERRVYSIQEIAIEARPDQVQELRDQLGTAKSINEFVDYLKAAGLRFSGNQAVRSAEQLPFNTLDAMSKMKDGQAMVVPSPTGVQVIVLAGSRVQPASEEQSRPAIEQYLLNERKRKLVEEDMKALRAAAKIEFVGKFAQSAASAPAAAPAAAPGTATNPATNPATSPATSPTPAASAGLSSTDINKGLGLK